MKYSSLMRRVIAVASAAALLVTSSAVAAITSENVSAASAIATLASTSTVTIQTASGAEESAYATWSAVTDATGYNVYYKKSGGSYTQVDSMLIRQYSDCFRVDIPGLSAGSYTLKIVPVIGGSEDTSKQAETTSLSVESYDRTGFAFTDTDGSCGAYNADGTLKDDAIVLYLTEETKDTMTLEIATKEDGSKTAVYTGIQYILDAIKSQYETRPVCIRVIGEVTDPEYTASGDMLIDGNKSNTSGKAVTGGVTLEGIGEDAVLNGWGIRLKNISSCEIRNLATMLVDSDEGDNVGLQQDNDHVWVHNCDFFYGLPGSDSDQKKGDGALDCKKSTYITFSYNHFWDNGKCNLLGLSEGTTEGLYITYHHNWYDHSDSRHPRVRYYSAHVYNNYYDGNAKYGIGACLGCSVFAESNYFNDCKYPMMISMQGSDILEGTDNATFSKEDGGMIKAYGNYMVGQKSFISYQEDNTEFDAYVVSSRSETVPSTVTSSKGGNTYNNFDTGSVMYSYTADAAEDVPEIVTAKAGRLNGGDIQFTFTEADASSADVNDELMALLTSYTSPVVAIGSGFSDGTSGNTGSGSTDTGSTDTGSTDTGSTDTGSSGSSSSTTPGNETHNFTENGLDSTFYTIIGNLSTSKGTVTYNGLTLTQCLKLETGTSITFSTTASGSITLVFVENEATIYVDGIKYIADGDGIITVSLAAGDHTITKANTANLFYMVYADNGSSSSSGDTSGGSSDVSGSTVGTQIHNFTENGLDSDFYTIIGNLSTSKGTVTYNGLTLTQCLKLETDTSITFSTTASGSITLVFVEEAATIYVDGIKYTAGGDGIITVSLAAGDHTITKANTANLFYMVYTDSDDTTGDPVVTSLPSDDTTTETTETVPIIETTKPEPVETSEPTSTQETELLIGDVTGDGEINLADAVFLAKMVSDSVTYNETQAQCGDCDGVPGLSDNDILTLLKLNANLISSLPL